MSPVTDPSDAGRDRSSIETGERLRRYSRQGGSYARIHYISLGSRGCSRQDQKIT